MTVTATHDVLSDGSAVVEVTDDGDANQLQVRGILIPENAVSEGLSGRPTRWPAETLEEAAERGVFEGRPITIPDALDPEQHVGVQRTDTGLEVEGAVPLHAKVGEIESTQFDSGTGLLFEGFVADGEAIDLVQRGLAQISPVLSRDLEEVDAGGSPHDRLFEATEISGVRDVGIVADGGMPGNEIEAMAGWMAEALAQRFDEPAESGADSPGGDDGQTAVDDSSIRDSSDTTMTDNTDPQLTDEEREVLRKLDRFDEPVLVEQADAEALSRADELLAAADDVGGDVEVVAKDEYEALQGHVETIDAELGSALVETRGLKEATVEAMNFEAKVAEFSDGDDGISLEALSQTPETSGGSVTSPDANSDGNLDDEALDRIKQIDTKLHMMRNSLPRSRVEALQKEACDLADVDDYSDALEVV